MKLDTRKPLLVLLGAWNPAIFHPAWVAIHLLNYREGTEISGTVLQEQPTGRTVTYIDRVGYHATPTRFELFLQSYSEDNFGLVEDIVSRLMATLPHTPFGDFGVNYRFAEHDPSPEVLDLLGTKDNLDHHFRILSQNLAAKIDFEGGCELNFKRLPREDVVEFDFNYHHSVRDKEAFQKIQSDYLQRLLQQSVETLRVLYGLGGYDELKHDFREAQEGEVDDD